MADLLKNEHDSALSRRGIAGWVIDAWNSRRLLGEHTGKQIQVMETLSVGARRNLMLVRCGEEYFLVGGGLESISAIVKVQAPEATSL